MRTVKFRLYLLEVLLILSLFFALFALNIDKKYIVLPILFITALLTPFMLNKKKDKNISGKQVSLLMLIFALIYLGIFYFLGLFHGFIKSKYPLSTTNIIKVILL